MNELLEHADDQKSVSKKVRRPDQDAAIASVEYGTVVEVDGVRGA